MDIWQVLGIERTTDKRIIKRAYGRKVARYHPEEYPDEFKVVYEAYEMALEYAKEYGDTSYTDTMTNALNADFEDIHSEDNTNMSNDEEVCISESELCDEIEKRLDFNNLVQEETDIIYGQRGVFSSEQLDVDFSVLKGYEQERINVMQNDGGEAPFPVHLIETERIKLTLKAEDKIDFAVIENRFDNQMSDEEIQKLLETVRKLLYCDSNGSVRRWKKLLRSDIFVKGHSTERFLCRFTDMIENVRLTKRIAGLIYVAMDFGELEKEYPYEKYAPLKELLLSDIEGRQRKTKDKISKISVKACIIFSIIWYLLMQFIKIYYLEDYEVSKLDTTEYGVEQSVDDEKLSQAKVLEEILEDDYGSEFVIQEIGNPTDIMEVYYLISSDKTSSDYRWFLVETDYKGVAMQFYVAWNEEEGYHHDYLYRQMFAIIQYSGLGDYVEDKDNYNMKYYQQGEQRYAYPVLGVMGPLGDDFYASLEQCIRSIQQSDVVFSQRDMVKLNFVNLDGETMYTLEITRDDPKDMENLKLVVGSLATGHWR